MIYLMNWKEETVRTWSVSNILDQYVVEAQDTTLIANAVIEISDVDADIGMSDDCFNDL